jgi:hypothetical protein
MSTLRLTFTGMCLYAQDGNEMHVLMPKHDPAEHGTNGGGEPPHHGAEPGTGWPTASGHYTQAHAARLTFDIAHLQPGQSEEAGYDAHVSLVDRRLVIPEVGRDFDPTFPDEVAKVGSGVKPGVLSGELPVLAARVLIRRGRPVVEDPGVCWDWGDSRRQLTHQVVWVVEDFPDEPLQLELGGIRAGTGGTLPALYPVDGKLNLDIWHIPVGELPPIVVRPEEPTRSTPAPHFHTYAELLVDPAFPIPRYVAARCSQDDPRPWMEGRKGAYPYGCLSARV